MLTPARARPRAADCHPGNKQNSTILRSGLQGRVIDHVRNTQSFGLEDLQALILDEADRLLEMGFAAEVGGWVGRSVGRVLGWVGSRTLLHARHACPTRGEGACGRAWVRAPLACVQQLGNLIPLPTKPCCRSRRLCGSHLASARQCCSQVRGDAWSTHARQPICTSERRGEPGEAVAEHPCSDSAVLSMDGGAGPTPPSPFKFSFPCR